MKDKLLYLTIGLLIGMVVMQWTMPSGQASDAISGSGLIAIEGQLVLDEFGQVWTVEKDPPGPGWFSASERGIYPAGLPVPLSDIKFWCGGILITEDNVAWRNNPGSPPQWVNCGAWPGGPVPTSGQTWGGVKGTYKK